MISWGPRQVYHSNHNLSAVKDLQLIYSEGIHFSKEIDDEQLVQSMLQCRSVTDTNVQMLVELALLPDRQNECPLAMVCFNMIIKCMELDFHSLTRIDELPKNVV